MLDLEPHPRKDELIAVFDTRRDLREVLVATVYRGARPRYAGDPEFVDGRGSLAQGGRWNPPNVCRTVYAAFELNTILDEALAGSRALGIPDWAALPVTLRAVECGFQDVIDLRTPAIPLALGVDLDAVLGEDWRVAMNAGRETLAQAIGHAAFLAEVEALLAPSALNRLHSNILWFPDNLLDGSRLTPRA